MMNLKIVNKEEEFLEPILKDNSLFILDKNTFFKFYYQFYQCLENKDKNIKINIGEKMLEPKNTILFSFCDYKEILENLKYKKGTLFYEYLLSCLGELNILEEDVVFYDIANIAKNITEKANVKVFYNLEEDIEKLLFSTVDFTLDFEVKNIVEVLKNLLKSYIEKNQNKIFIIFYDSSLLPLKFEYFDFCYTFDISEQKDLDRYNLICMEEIKKFDINSFVEKLESIWPVEFYNEKVINYVQKYFIFKKCNISLIAHEEPEYLTYKLMSKIYNEEISIKLDNSTIRDNNKSFLEQI